MSPWPLLCLLLGPTGQEASETGRDDGFSADGHVPERLQSAALSVEGLPRDAFIEALSLRSPVTIVDGAPVEGIHVHVSIRPAPDRTDTFLIELIVSDGRAYDREFVATGSEATRIAATTVAQLLAAVEDGQVQPDRSDVPFPARTPAVEAPPKPGPTPGPVPVSAPAPRFPASARPPPPSTELGLTVGVGAALGLNPMEGLGPFAGAGGVLGLDTRFPNGVLFGVGARWAGAHHDEWGLLRARFSLGAGYVWRIRTFELPIVLSATVEPWWVLDEGRVASVSESPAGPPLALGGALRLAPRVRIHPRRGSSKLALAVGPRFELDLTTVPQLPLGGARIVDASNDDGQAVFRVGGIELWLGLDLTVWFEVR